MSGDSSRPTHRSLNWVWDTNLLTWVAETQPGGNSGGGTSSSFGAAFPAAGTAAGFISSAGKLAGANLDASGNLLVNVAAGGSGGGAVTVADGADVVQGATTDAAVTSDANGTISGKLRGLVKLIASVISGGAVTVNGSGVTQPVSGTFFQATQPVSIATMPTTPVMLTTSQLTTLTPPAAITGFALETGGNLASIKADTDKIPSQGQALAASSMPVVLTAIQQAALTPPSNTGYALDSSLSTIDTDIKSNITLHAGTNVIGHVIVDSGSITTPAITNDGTFAKETGGNLASIATNTTSLATYTDLTTLDTDLKATQPRSITNFPAIQPVSEASGANIDLASLLRTTLLDHRELLQSVLIELRVMNTNLVEGIICREDTVIAGRRFVKEDLSVLRADENLALTLN